jgi:4-hydroxy-tetrahydrodipicolinate reductase
MRIAVSGAAGRMGKKILALGHDHSDIEISGALERTANPALGTDAGENAGIGRLGVPITADVEGVLKECDVLIDFSAPAASVEHVKAAAAGKAIVVGTGFSEDQRRTWRKRNRIDVWLPLLSMGSIFCSASRRKWPVLWARIRCGNHRAHHRMKKDAPSGTADKLAQVIASALGRDLKDAGTYGRHGLVGERKPNEIGVMAVRGGDIVGDHTVMFVTNGERIELTHRAHSRDAFAKGAIQAALWLVPRPNGLYDMQDVLGLKAK